MKNVFSLMTFEYETLPVVLLEQILPLDMIWERFPEVATLYMNGNGNTGYTAKDFHAGGSAVQIGNRNCQVAVFTFPFAEYRDYVGLARRLYMVFSEDLQGVHLFLETYRERVTDNGVKPYYDIMYIAREENGVTYYTACECDGITEEDGIRRCAGWAVRIEEEGIIGDVEIIS